MCVQSITPIALGNPCKRSQHYHLLISIIIDGVLVCWSILPAILEKPSFMATVGKWPGNTTKVFRYLWSARTTLRIVRQTVFLLSFSASPTSYKYVPLAKKRKAIQIICGTVVAWLRRVGFLIWGSRSRQRYNIPSAENRYFSCKFASENARGFCLSLRTLSLRKAFCTIWAPISTGLSRNGEAILLLVRSLWEWTWLRQSCVTLLTVDWSNVCLRAVIMNDLEQNLS